MLKERIKNVFLIVLILIAFYLSSKIWLKFDLEIGREEIPEEILENIYLWDKIRPSKIAVSVEYEYQIYEVDYIKSTWELFLNSFQNILKQTYIEEDIFLENLEGDNVKIIFDNPIPTELFAEGLGSSNNRFFNKIRNVLWAAYNVENKKYYINDGTHTYSLSLDYEDEALVNAFNDLKEYAVKKNDSIFNAGNPSVYIPLPKEENVLNPIFIKSEIDSENMTFIEKIAKDYFKEKYDYVRTTIESTGNINYIYRNEKVLRIYREGFLEFYDSMESTLDDSNINNSFKIALNFIEDFLGFPDNAYLSEVVFFSRDGKYGYSFIFSYNLFDRPIIFSQVREEKPIKIDVIGSKVVYYQRFIRELDYSMETEMNEVKVITPEEIINTNIDFITLLYLEEFESEDLGFEEAKEKILNSIYDIKLAYFDPSRNARDQLLRSVWVFRTEDRQYVFNAITGAIIEEQILEGKY